MFSGRTITPADFAAVYARFQSPIAKLDCGKKCAPYNEKGVPFCCDIHHAVPTAYQEEWQYLKVSTDLWHLWNGENPEESNRLRGETPPGQELIACKGHHHCQRSFRALTCRAFPFFPYLTGEGEFIGLSYYWEYEDRCWVISNLQVVQPEYRAEFVAAYDHLFKAAPDERENFRHHSRIMREIFASRQRSIPVLHRDGLICKISPVTEKMRRISADSLPRFGPYRIAAKLPFPDEIQS
jgi:hypothetical protein